MPHLKALQPVTIDGASGVICNNLALVTDGGRGYWVLAYTSGDEPWVGKVYDDAWFATSWPSWNFSRRTPSTSPIAVPVLI